MLLLLKTVNFEDTDKDKFDSLYKSVMPAAAQAVFDEGYSLYNKRDYANSLKKLEKVQLYQPDFTQAAAVLYYMGRCSQQLNDARNAIALFQKVVDNYPGTSFAKNAGIKINALTQLP